LEENHVIKRLTLYWEINHPPFLTQFQISRRPITIGYVRSDMYIEGRTEQEQVALKVGQRPNQLPLSADTQVPDRDEIP